MSAFARNPRRSAYEAAGRVMGSRTVGMPPRTVPLSAQNRRVRFAVDTDEARAKTFPNAISRQQLRREKLTGHRIVTHNPDEVED